MRIASSVVLLCFSFAASSRSDDPQVVDVWPGAVPGESAPIGEEKYTAQKPAKLLTNVSKPTLTVFRPAKDKDVGAAVIVCPGGGYHILAWDLEGEEVCHWLNSIGVTGVILKYRVPRRPGQPGYKPPPGPQQDAQRAVSLVRSKAKEWSIDPNRIGILGFSAGGHLAAATSLGFGKRTYEAADDVDKVSCKPDFTVLVYPAYLMQGKELKLSSEFKVAKDAPPTFFAHAADDPISADNSIVLYRALRAANVSAEMHLYASGGHGFGLRPSTHPCCEWPKRCEEWMKAKGWLKK